MKKPVSPAPTARAAALSQSAGRHASKATSAWQSIAGNSPQLTRRPGTAREATPLTPPAAPGAGRLGQQAPHTLAPATPASKQETIRQVGWREVDRAVGMTTKRKYNLFGIGFGPKVPVFDTEKVKLPVYQETDREKRYFTVVKLEDIDNVKNKGIQPKSNQNQLSSNGSIRGEFIVNNALVFFDNKLSAEAYSRKYFTGSCAVVEFSVPEYHNFIQDKTLNSSGYHSKYTHTNYTISTESISAANIVGFYAIK